MKELQNGQFEDAAGTFDKVISISGSNLNLDLDGVRIKAGYAYLRAGKFPEAIDRLSKATGVKAKPADQATALYCTALAQFSEGQQKSAERSLANGMFEQAEGTLTTLIDFITNTPTADTEGYLEQGIYYRALARYFRENYDGAEEDLAQLIQKFNTSLSRPEYLLRLGSIYALQVNQAVTEKKPAGDIRTLAERALDAFNNVSNDPNALVQANEANMSKAEVLFLIAQLDTTPAGLLAGYEKALEAFRKVRRKADMIQLQQNRLNDLRAEAAKASSDAARSNEISNLISREENRLDELTKAPDPIIQALIRMAECYVCMKRPDETRTILHRISAHATLTPEQQKEVDFQTLYSYVLGGQTDQADKALDNYLSKHAGDPNADSFSYQIAAALLGRNDNEGALHQAQRSLTDFSNGKYAAAALMLEAQALTRLGRTIEADELLAKYLREHPTGPQTDGVLFARAQTEAGAGNLKAALDDYKTVKSDSSAGAELQGVADIQYIETLDSLHQFDAVISEVKAFESQYPDRKELPNMLLLAALAMDQNHDPGAIAALQDIARKFPQSDVAPRALSDIVTIYQRANNTPAMIQAATDLRKAYPDAYAFLAQVADTVSGVLVKEREFDEAMALYQPLTSAPTPEAAAAALNKIGEIELAAAKESGANAEGEKRSAAAQEAYQKTLKNFPDQLGAVDAAFAGLVNTAIQRRSWDLLKDADFEGYLGKLGADLTTPEMEARLELAKAGLVFVFKNRAGQYAAALDRFKKVIGANPGLHLTPQETEQFGELLLVAKDYPMALKIYRDLLNNADPTDHAAQGDGYYGLGAIYLAQGDLANAKSNFLKLKATFGGGRWHPHILDADYGIARADEQSGQPADIAEARQIYGDLMQNASSATLQANAMLGYGRLLEKAGNALKPATGESKEYAIFYYQEPNLLLGPAVSELSAEGLFDAGQAYEKAADNPNAKKEYDMLLNNYRTTTPDWAAKAQAAEAQLAQ